MNVIIIFIRTTHFCSCPCCSSVIEEDESITQSDIDKVDAELIQELKELYLDDEIAES